ncbi:kinase-like domain-containing protein [Stachybotrys elegans]|uniref:mitogen-activated protein kinase n=1 Tax=Stachybotrys elegans TaxID=80388 RepID=A0A8K0SKC2_9HYPO|nr:kinase-like domain-containing protein [Stachybotrys elegans]
MFRTSPHDAALFTLLPMNEAAEGIVRDPANSHLATSLRLSGDTTNYTIGFDIGPHVRPQSAEVLATIGRAGDIHVPDPDISREHCSFQRHRQSREVMFYDMSSNKNSSLIGSDLQRFNPGYAHRRVLLDWASNTQLAFGGPDGRRYMFRILWHTPVRDIVENERAGDPRQARTLLHEPSMRPPSSLATLVQPHPNRYRYIRRARIGRGSFGKVFLVALVDSGEHVAMKVVRLPDQTGDGRAAARVHMEIEALAHSSHEHIVRYRWSQVYGQNVEIFMDLKMGTLHNVISNGVFEDERQVDLFMHQTLRALDYLASQEVIHRDIKPDNILYSIDERGRYHYQIADFGLAKLIPHARSYVGTYEYMAPEMNQRGQPQTSKVDIWSLFATLAFATNAAGFRDKLHSRTLNPDVDIAAAAEEPSLSRFKDMASRNPAYRPTARELLDRLDRLYAEAGQVMPWGLM